MKKILISIASVLSVLAFISAFYFSRLSLTVFPHTGERKFDVAFIDDSAEGGNSVILKSSVDSVISFSYILKNAINFPFCIISFDLRYPSGAYPNFTKFDSVIIVSSSNRQNFFRLQFLNYDPILTDTNNIFSFRYSESLISTSKNLTRFSAPLKTFSTPPWWYARTNVPPHYTATHFATAGYFQIINGPANDTNAVHEVVIKEVLFKGIDRNLRLFFLLLIPIIWAIVFSWLYLLRAREKLKTKRENILESYERLEVKSYKEQERDRLYEYIKNNFTEPELSIDIISDKLGISKIKISDILKKDTNTSFKVYLNNMRLEYSCKLLKNSSKSIIEIALDCGYNNVSYFNRLFKETYSISPSSYRKNSPPLN